MLSKYSDNDIKRFWFACKKVKIYLPENYKPDYEKRILEELNKRNLLKGEKNVKVD